MADQDPLHETAESALEAARERSAESRRRHAEEQARVKRSVGERRRLLRCLEAAWSYASDQKREVFVREWARRWRAASRAWRKYAPNGALASVAFPAAPEYDIALAIFRLALRGAPLTRIEVELQQSTRDLWEDSAIWALRDFFFKLREHVVSIPMDVAVQDQRSAMLGDRPCSTRAAARDVRPLWELKAKRDRNNHFRSVTFACQNAKAATRAVTLTGLTATPLVVAVASQAGQEHRWDELARELTSAGVSTCAARTLQRTGRRVRERLPEELRPLWSQSKSGVRLDADVEFADAEAGVVKLRLRS